MKQYNCNHCHSSLYFENSICLHCQHPVGFDPASLSMITLVLEDVNLYSNIGDRDQLFNFCKNAEYGVCNWLLPAAHPSSYCRACEMNRVIPALSIEDNLKSWKSIEMAKHRLVYSLMRLGLPMKAKKENEEEGIAFEFLADSSQKEKIVTGHDHGVITLNIEEADEVARVRYKLDLGEQYRTLLGHFRHEIGHYYWELLIRNSPQIIPFREIFGNEEIDYAKALEEYYQRGAPADWSEHFISPYASSHPWEDWAETWANYLHMMDALETGNSFGIRIKPAVKRDNVEIETEIIYDPYGIEQFGKIMDMWLSLSFAVNSLNRSMGHADFYPFVISSGVERKLEFIHRICNLQRN